jgi:Tol biopolymer transport system component
VQRRTLLVLAALCALAFAAPSSSARRLPRNGLLVFGSESHATEVMVANADGTAVRRITDDPSASRWPELSPDGTQIAYAQRVGNHRWAVVVSALDGTSRRELPTEGYALQPTWAPDGTRIAYATGAGDRTHPLHLEVYDVAAGSANAIDAATPGARPSWSPDGTHLAFACTKSEETQLCVVGADGTGERVLSTRGGFDLTSSWSPDGTRIVFSADTSSGPTDLFEVNVDGTGLVNLTNTQDTTEDDPAWTASGIVFWSDADGQGAYLMQPDGTGARPIDLGGTGPIDVRASRDGRFVAFTTGAFALHNLATIAPGGASPKALTTGAAYDDQPAWSPDGRTVAFRRQTSTGSGVETVDANGRGLRQVTHGSDAEPAWSPDGKRIAFVRLSSTPRLWIVDRNGRNAHLLTGSTSAFPSWSPNGKQIAFLTIGPGGLGISILTLATHKSRVLTAGMVVFGLAWSPDGRSLAYTSYASDGSIDVFVIDLATKKSRRVTRTASHPQLDQVVSVAWAPDGTQIVYTTASFSLGVSEYTTYAIRRDGRGERTVIGSQLGPSTVSWQPRR